MEKIQTIESFYSEKLNWMPDTLKKEMGHFNVFRLDDCICSRDHSTKGRRDFYKITLLRGNYLVHYADRTIETKQYALLFSAPLIPYYWETLEEHQSGFFCIFTETFFNNFGAFKDYPMFKPGNSTLFLIPEDKLPEIERIYNSMFEELESDFMYKYDVLRGLVFNLIHSALKLQPAEVSFHHASNASSRISSMFTELLERQFPIESLIQRIRLRSPIDFSQQLSVHVNHLNRSLKEITGKTTSQIISERIAQEAKVLLKHTTWNVSEIAFSLGFEELPHFTNFFKKNFGQTPKAFRESQTV